MSTDAQIGGAYRKRQAAAAKAQKGHPSPAQSAARRANAIKARIAYRESQARRVMALVPKREETP